jgi:hypothetical protein
MNYVIKAVRIFMKGSDTSIEDYEKEVSTFTEAMKEENRLKSLGDYSNITIKKLKKYVQ